MILEQVLLAGAQLDAEARPSLFRGRAVGCDELIQTAAAAPPPPLGVEIAQHCGHHGEGYQALLPVDDLKQARLAVARLGQVPARAVEQEYRAQEVVGFRCIRAEQTRRPEDILEQLPRFLGGPRIRPLITGDRIVEGKREQIGDSQGRCWQTREHRTSLNYFFHVACGADAPGPRTLCEAIMTGWSMTDILSEIVTHARNKQRPVLTKCDKVGET